jgi:hypothetical protein
VIHPEGHALPEGRSTKLVGILFPSRLERKQESIHVPKPEHPLQWSPRRQPAPGASPLVDSPVTDDYDPWDNAFTGTIYTVKVKHKA